MDIKRLQEKGFSNERIEEMKVAFSLFGGGVITPQAIAALFNSLGQAFSQNDLEMMITEFTGDRSKRSIDFFTFATILDEKMDSWVDAFGDAFDIIDRERTGSVGLFYIAVLELWFRKYHQSTSYRSYESFG